MKTRTSTILIILSSIFIVILIVVLYNYMSGEQRLYQAVIEKQSLDEAKKFFDKYPKSNHRSELEKLVRDWALEEDDQELYQITLSILPKDSPYREEIEKAYKKNNDSAPSD